MSERTREWTRSRRSANTFFPRAAQQPHVGQLYEWATLFVGDYFCKTDVREICSGSANPNGGASDLFKNNDDDGHLCFNFIYTYASHTHTRTSRSIPGSIHFFHCGGREATRERASSRSLENIWLPCGRAASEIYGLPLGFIKILSNFTPRRGWNLYQASAAFIVDLIYTQLSESSSQPAKRGAWRWWILWYAGIIK